MCMLPTRLSHAIKLGLFELFHTQAGSTSPMYLAPTSVELEPMGEYCVSLIIDNKILIESFPLETNIILFPAPSHKQDPQKYKTGPSRPFLIPTYTRKFPAGNGLGAPERMFVSAITFIHSPCIYSSSRKYIFMQMSAISTRPRTM